MGSTTGNTPARPDYSGFDRSLNDTGLTNVGKSVSRSLSTSFLPMSFTR